MEVGGVWLMDGEGVGVMDVGWDKGEEGSVDK